MGDSSAIRPGRLPRTCAQERRVAKQSIPATLRVGRTRPRLQPLPVSRAPGSTGGRLKEPGQRSESKIMAGIKGTAIQSLVADVNRVVQEGRIRPDELEACLQREDLEILGQKVLAALWYP